MQRAAVLPLFVAVGTGASAAVGASAAFADSGDATTTTVSNASTTTTTTTSGYHPVPAILILLLAILVIAIALFFAYKYHKRVLKSVDAAVRGGHGDQVDVSNDDVGVQALSRVATDSGIAISGPAQAVVGEKVKFSSTGVEAGDTVSWTVEGTAAADPASASTTEFETKFTKAGSATVTIAVAGKADVAPLTVTVVANETAAARITLPFVVRNWGRLVVVLFGAGLVACLMVLNVISGEGGIGLLGALFGVGAATATHGVAAPAAGGGAAGADDS